MKTFRKSLSYAASCSLFAALLMPILSMPAMAQDTAAALQRGYRTGYSDGYMAGYRDIIENTDRDFAKHAEYSDASRAYNAEYGPIEDYRAGYRRGFEIGYGSGYEKKAYDSTVPVQIIQPKEDETAVDSAPSDEKTAAEPTVNQTVSYKPAVTGGDDDAIIVIPKDVEIIIELQQDLSTDKNRQGDRFTAKVLSPSEIGGAIIEGRIDRIQKPGRIKRRSEMLLTFDRIVISQSRWSNMSAVLTDVLAVRGDNVSRIDDEGSAIGKGSMKEDSIKVGTTTGVGLGIGAIAAGPVGAAVGAGVGAAFGVGTVLTERGKHIRLNENQQLRIQTTLETRIR